MKSLTKDNLEEFMNTYHNLHDRFITSVNYNTEASEIELLINAFQSKNNDQEFSEQNNISTETQNIKLRMMFSDIVSCSIQVSFPWELIKHALFKNMILQDEELLCFANDETNPSIYIISSKAAYEELALISW